jgi:LysR family glycine cleavage system transcriptional activator
MKDTSRRLLPPMAALHSFSAAARHGSFSRAGDEVGLTQSAVSRQIAHLEDWLGVALFDRNGRRVVLTAEGRSYADAIGAGLDRIRRATALAMDRHPTREMTIATLPSFGMRWLAPRLPRLTAQHSHLVVNFAARTSEFDFAQERFDAAIHFGNPDWPGASHDLLFREQALPVCAPSLLERIPVTSPADFLNMPLLLQGSRLDAWSTWFKQAGVAPPVGTAGPSFEHFLMLAQAAVAGMGAALIPTFLIQPELESGALVAPIPWPIASDQAYYLVYPPQNLANPHLRELRRWILDEVAADASEPPGGKPD